MSILSKTIKSSPQAAGAPALKANTEVSVFLSKVIQVCLHVLILFLPLLVSPWTIDILELGKQTFLVIVVSIAAIAWIGKIIADKQFTLIRHWVHLMVLLFGVGYLVVALFSQDTYLSFVGAFGEMPWSFVTIASLVLLYFIVVHHVRKTSQVYNLILTFLLSSFLVAFYGLLQIFGWHIFHTAVTDNRGFSSVGTMFSLATFLVVPILISASLLFHGCKNKVCHLGSAKPLGVASRVLLWGMLLLGLFDLVLVDFWGAWAGLIFGMLLTLSIGLWRSRAVRKPVSFIAPLVVLILAGLFLVIKSPIPTSIPGEASPSLGVSWAIATKTLEQHPLTGSGPGTWMYDYALYRVQGINLSPFWQTRFDRGFSFFMTFFATTGLIGVILWVTLIVSGIVKSVNCLLREKDEDIWYAYLTVFTGWLTLVFLTFIYNLNMPHTVALWFLFALLGAMVSRGTLSWDAKKNPIVYGVFATLFILIIIGGISASWFVGQRYAAELVFSQAVQAHQANKSIDTYLPLIARATELNAKNDMYVRNLSQAHLLKAIQLIQQDPNRTESIQRELKATIDHAIDATTLSPMNMDNWSNLGLIYANVASFIPGADEKAISAFTKAHDLDPQNPIILTEIGKMYLLRADAYQTNVGNQTKDQTEVAKNIKDNLTLAEQQLQEAIVAKPDYFPARYYLGVVYEREGNLQQAITELERVVEIDHKNVGVAFELSILYYRNNQKAEALNLMEQILRFSPDNANALWYISSMYEERGNTEAAIAALERLQQQFPDHEAVKQRLNALRTPKTPAPSLEALPAPLEQGTGASGSQNVIQP